MRRQRHVVDRDLRAVHAEPEIIAILVAVCIRDRHTQRIVMLTAAALCRREADIAFGVYRRRAYAGKRIHTVGKLALHAVDAQFKSVRRIGSVSAVVARQRADYRGFAVLRVHFSIRQLQRRHVVHDVHGHVKGILHNGTVRKRHIDMRRVHRIRGGFVITLRPGRVVLVLHKGNGTIL